MKKLIYPDICCKCGMIYNVDGSPSSPPDFTFENVFSDILCKTCIKKYKKFDPHSHCERCGKKIEGLVCDESLCEECIKGGTIPDKIRSSFYFTGAVVDIIHLLKYNDACFLAGMMSPFLFQSYLENFINEDVDFLIPVPMHIKKMRRRGYNQVQLMAGELFKFAERAGVDFPRLTDDLIFKKVNTRSQTKLGVEERRKNLKNVFCLSDKISVENKSILIIDDVVTTGSTLNECASTLKCAGASAVFAITFARA